MQLYTGCIRLNQYLTHIRAAELPTYQCGAAPKSLKHFLFSCIRQITQRKRMYDKQPGKEGDIRFFTEAKSVNDIMAWQPDLEAIKTMIGYIRATAKFDTNTGQREPQRTWASLLLINCVQDGLCYFSFSSIPHIAFGEH